MYGVGRLDDVAFVGDVQITSNAQNKHIGIKLIRFYIRHPIIPDTINPHLISVKCATLQSKRLFCYTPLTWSAIAVPSTVICNINC